MPPHLQLALLNVSPATSLSRYLALLAGATQRLALLILLCLQLWAAGAHSRGLCEGTADYAAASAADAAERATGHGCDGVSATPAARDSQSPVHPALVHAVQLPGRWHHSQARRTGRRICLIGTLLC